MSLEELRSNVLQINAQLIDLFQQRSKIIKSIQSIKLNNSNPCFNPHVELNIYLNLGVELKKLPLEKVLALSLLIEADCSKENTGVDMAYPKWSESAHIKDRVYCISEQINPVLLAIAANSELRKLSFKHEYVQLLNELELLT